MKLSLFSDYSLRVLIYGAVKGGPFQLDEVTNAYDISRHHLAKIVHQLSKLGYLETKRGRGGGIRLAKAAEDVPIGRLVRETEDQPAIVECFDSATNTCKLNGHCRLKGYLAEAMNAFYDSLNQHTLRDLVAGPFSNRMGKILLPSVRTKTKTKTAK